MRATFADYHMWPASPFRALWTVFGCNQGLKTARAAVCADCLFLRPGMATDGHFSCEARRRDSLVTGPDSLEANRMLCSPKLPAASNWGGRE